MSEQVYKCGIGIEHPRVVCGYVRPGLICSLQPDTPCQYKFKSGNAKPENKNGK